jgi:hypothetical protein
MDRNRYEQWFPSDVGGMLDSINSVTGLNLSLIGGDKTIIGDLEQDPPWCLPDSGTVELWAGIEYAGVVFTSWDEATLFVRGIFYGVFRGPSREAFVAFFKRLSAQNATNHEGREYALFQWIIGAEGRADERTG